MNDKQKKTLKTVACVILAIAALGGLFNAITTFQVVTALGGGAFAAAFQAVVAFLFSTLVFTFIGAVGTIVVAVIAAVLIGVFTSNRNTTGEGANPGNTDKPADTGDERK
jgi:hypothetical protein